jgi:lipopolysaccharide transport system permease protein
MPSSIYVKVITAPSFSPAAIFRNVLDLGRYTDLLYTLSLHRVKVRYKQSMLGLAWAILQPLLLMLVYTVIFSLFAKVSTDGTPYPVFVYSSVLIWSLFSTGLTNIATSMTHHRELITKVYFPREILPLTYVVAAVFDLLVASVILGGLMIYYRLPLTWNALFAFPVVLVAVTFVTGLGLVLSAVQVRYRDIGLAMPLVLQLWMFATPVVYPLSAVPAKYRGLYDLNPMVGVVENFRRVVVLGETPEFPLLAKAALASCVLLLLSYLYFKNREATMADII